MRAAAAGEPFDRGAVPDLPAVAGFCAGCGKRLDQRATATGQQLCTASETSLQGVRLHTAEAEVAIRRAKDAEIMRRLRAQKQARSHVALAGRLADWWKSVS